MNCKRFSSWKLAGTASLLFMASHVFGQNTTDTTSVDKAKEELRTNIPIIILDDNDSENNSGNGGQSIASLLYGGRDPYFSNVFNFNAARFRVRGYDNSFTDTYINGAPVKNLTNGSAQWSLWGGLNDVMRNREVSYGLRPVDFTFGDIGGTTALDIRASKQRPQLSFGYANTNRNYNHRAMLSWASGLNEKGWAFAFAGSFRYAGEGYVDGTFYDGASYYAAVDKKVNNHLFSFTTFGTPTVYGGQAAAVKEMYGLAGSNFYNPLWGYQNGEKRSASYTTTFQPHFILTHEWDINPTSKLTTAASYSLGERYRTALDWYNAQDPRPDYYRNLPSYATIGSVRDLLTDLLSSDAHYRQVDWDKIYDTNRNSFATVDDNGNSITGLRSRYILEDRVTATNKFNVNTVFNTELTEQLKFTGGAYYSLQKDRNFKRLNDLLGGNFYLNINQFAERDFPNNNTVNQNDIDNPNRVIYEGDKFGYNYDMNVREAKAFAQTQYKTNKVDYFLAGALSYTSQWREGNVRNGLFPNNSFGKSKVYDFLNYQVKGGITYKIDGRNYVYANGSIGNRAPFVDNVFISARNRNDAQASVESEKVQSAEAGYVLNWEKLKLRVNGYYASFENGMDVVSYYDESYQNFVNYSTSNVDKEHYGVEFGVEFPLYKGLKMSAAANIGRYYFTSRQNAIVTVDNSAEIVANETVYSKNYYVGQTPQEAYTVAFNYQGRRNWFANINGNMFRKSYMNMNPVRRTARAVENVTPGSDLWYDILRQEEIGEQFTVDVFGGKSFRVKTGRKYIPMSLTIGVNNLLNNRDFITGGFEQLRFDFTEKNPNKFPSKYYYAYGANYFISLSARL